MPADRRCPTRTTMLGRLRVPVRRAPPTAGRRDTTMRCSRTHVLDGCLSQNDPVRMYESCTVTRYPTRNVGPGSRASTSTAPPWWGNENHGLTLRVCPCSAHERTPATTFTQRTPVTRRINSIQPIDSSTRTHSQCAHVLFVEDRVQTCFTAGCAEQRTPVELVDSPSGAQQNNAREAPCHRSLSPKAAAPLP